jgi:hypothetical protein
MTSADRFFFILSNAFFLSLMVLALILELAEMRPSLRDRSLVFVGLAAVVFSFVVTGLYPLAIGSIYVVLVRELEIWKDTGEKKCFAPPRASLRPPLGP